MKITLALNSYILTKRYGKINSPSPFAPLEIMLLCMKIIQKRKEESAMEIERKFLIKTLPENLEQYPFHLIEQAYLCTSPVVRIRRQDEEYILTWKGGGMMAREEYNLPLTKEGYEHMLPKADGNIITKKRYLIPLPDGLKAELDIFSRKFEGLMIVEVEFPDTDTAAAFLPPEWFAEEVTYSPLYHNSVLSKLETWPVQS